VAVPLRKVDAVRQFNRFYTRRIGVLDEGLLDSPFSLAESRVLYELAERERPTATELASALGLDAGYLSRILHAFERRRLVARTASADDRRQTLLKLTQQGARAFATLEGRTREQIGAMLVDLRPADQRRLIDAMRTIEHLLDGAAAPTSEPYLLRPHQPGDMGWVVHRHGLLYAQEYGYDEHFEALVAKIVASFLERFDPRRERCWIAERHGEMVGSVFLVKKSKTVAKLRLLLVEPSARGLGIGARLVSECVRFAKQAGYQTITLWTQSELTAARHLYERAGFRLTRKKRHDSFGKKNLIAETWDLTL
jgi:DNA-binding MarR family transcriptional regulator/N-acetylglutamate synthase-like GNAT family acetyltransferase